MGLVPKSNVDKIQFYEDHQPTNAVTIGTTPAEVTVLQTRTTATTL